MREIFCIYKRKGISPLDALKELRERCPDLAEVRMTYAGRLDPMAEGVLLVIAGKELKNFRDHLVLDKEYEGSVIFGVSTDTHDILGVPEKRDIREGDIKGALEGMKGEFSFPLPWFSSYRVHGKPLFWWKRQGREEEIEVPWRTVSIYNVEVRSIYSLTGEELLERVLRDIGRVRGDFRQERIEREWRNSIDKKDDFPVADIFVSCSSGCYIRSMAQAAGKKLGGGATLLHLRRIRIGDHGIEDCLFWENHASI